MAPLLALFLVALVGLPVAQALDCHVCAYNGENCFNPVRCPAMVTYCMTTRTWSWPTSPSLCRLQPDQDEGSWGPNGNESPLSRRRGPGSFSQLFVTTFQIWKQPACLRSGCLTVWWHLHGLLCRPSAWNTAAAPVQADVHRGGWTAASHLPL
ncbi:uncharacterized protein LOC118883637 isoform X1 [Balaenoptera musculus]|uniref:Uncharacterized protein LOC118883637 isoform X1 n=1 Tax=Balaenoptera musculus TaxID=9771 RepID=A0A8B8VNU0_BALMU|nr:uncharacterized protein LOC118883637 isoform X1 [Balaenoptera musculus]XP_036686559.1 uncharacterized protein LOC118883637 isoform X1 [Balaenoptera musculus]